METRLPRKLAAVLYADVAGYSRLTGDDEDGTHRRLSEYLDLISAAIGAHRGRVMHYAGDAVLAMFEAASDALSCAISIQDDLETRNRDLPAERKVRFRIGVNLGDVIEDRGDIYGDGVNVAARLESLAKAGGVCISESVRLAVGTSLPLDYESLGEQQVKNIAEPVKAYHASLKPGTEPPGPEVHGRPKGNRTRVVAMVAAIVVVVVAAGVLGWLQPWRQSTEPVPSQAQAPDTSAQPSIAVLPFDNMSGDPEQEFLTDGITEDIITELSRFPDLRVIARNSSFVYKGKATDAKQIASELGVRYVLEGSVRRSGEKVRVTAQLIDGTTGYHIWAESYDSSGGDVFLLQDEVTSKIIKSVSGESGEIRKAGYRHAWGKDAASLEEYDYFLRVHLLIYRFNERDMRQAKEIANEGLRKFPDSALLRIKLGWTYYHLGLRGWSDNPELDFERALQLANEGLKDPQLPPIGEWHGRWLRTLLYLWYTKDHVRALAEAEATLALVPNDSDTLVLNALVPLFMGKSDVALTWIRKALQSQPHVPEWYYPWLAWAHYQNGDYESAIREAKKQSWNDLTKLRVLAASYVQLGLEDEAQETVAEMLKVNPSLTLTALRSELPFQNRAHLDRELADLAKAGLPE